MHFHLPKPIHGWREFAGEIAIIVIGVLIALGAEQLIQQWHDRERVEGAIDALRDEVGVHDFAEAEIEMAAPCIHAQLDRIAARLKAGETDPVPRYVEEALVGGYVVRIPNRPYSDSTWQSVNATDTLRRLDPERAVDLSSYFGQLRIQRDVNRAALGRVASLNTLSALMPSGEAERLRFLELTEQLRSNISEMDLVGGQLRDSLARAELLPMRAARDRLLADSGTIKFCRAHGYPIAPLRPASDERA